MDDQQKQQVPATFDKMPAQMEINTRLNQYLLLSHVHALDAMPIQRDLHIELF